MSLSQTSRDSILDTIDLISNLASVPSHSQEVLRELRKEFEITGLDETKENIEILEILELDSLKLRRDIMTQILEELDGDSKYWCLMKHLIVSYGLSQELLQANYSNKSEEKYKNFTDRSFQLLLVGLKLFLKLPEIPTCSRCLSDATQSIKQSKLNQNES